MRLAHQHFAQISLPQHQITLLLVFCMHQPFDLYFYKSAIAIMNQGKLLVYNLENTMVTDSQGVTATTQSEIRASAKSRRRHKSRALKKAKRKAERSNGGK